ncbi:MAG: hypothetical protein ACKOBZ_02120 [Nitrospira sp.]
MSINWKAIVRDVSIVFGLVLVSSLTTSVIVQSMGGEVTPLVIGLSNIFWGTVGFVISGCLIVIQRFKHLFLVAIGLWLVSFVNVLAEMTQPTVWAAGLLLILLMMGLGGSLSYLFMPSPKPEATPPPTCET